MFAESKIKSGSTSTKAIDAQKTDQDIWLENEPDWKQMQQKH